MRRTLLALSLIVAGAQGAAANGRPPATSTIQFRQGHESDVLLGMTFGLLFSHDSGATWQWMCEDAVPYTGVYDPDYAYSSTGALFATTFDGLKVQRDGCTFEALPSGVTFTSSNTLGPDGAFYYAAAQIADTRKPLAKDFKIYKSTDNGVTFPLGVKPGDPADVNDWWETVTVAPSDAQRVYASGYSYMPVTPGGESVRNHLLFRSPDGGATWQPMATTGLTLAANSIIMIVGIASDDPDHLYARVKLVDNTVSDAIYVSTNAGASWTEINRKPVSIPAFAVRAALNTAGKHDLVVGTQMLGAEVSHDDGATWEALAGAPHLGCLVENAAGELWGCTQNYGASQIPSDFAGVMKTTDLVTWTKVLRFQDLTDAVSCPAGSLQHDKCIDLWCAQCEQLGCKPSPAYNCPTATAPDATVPPVDAPPVAPKHSGGCCEVGRTGGTGALALALLVGTVVRRPRRRRAP